MSEPVAFQTDNEGEKSNIEFLVSFLDEKLNTPDEWTVELEIAYAENYVWWVVEKAEEELKKLGYTVVWDEGVYIYHDKRK